MTTTIAAPYRARRARRLRRGAGAAWYGMGKVTREAIVAETQAGRVDAVVATLTGRSRSLVRGLIQHGCVTINALPCRSDHDRVAAGDTVRVTYDEERKYREPPRVARTLDAPFPILFEDEHLIVVDKPANWLTVPTPKGETDTLADLVQAYLDAGRPRAPRLAVVQRLDRGVSGVLVMAKNAAVGEALREQFAATKPERVYLALVAGRLAAEQGTFDAWLITDPQTLERRVAPRPGVGEPAVTHYTVEARGPGVTRVRVRLETGRRNQIRVHFAHAGHPVLGDPRYGVEQARHPRWRVRRLALHAAVLGFTHPVTGQAMRFHAPVPPEFDQVC